MANEHHFLPNDKFNANNDSYLSHMDEFMDYVLQFGNLNQQQIDLILKKQR